MSTKKEIFAYTYFNSLLGGSAIHPIVTDVDLIEEKEIGRGFTAFSFKTPKGTIRIAESTTGAIIANSFKEAKADVKASSRLIINDQLEKFKQNIGKDNCVHVEREEFFKKFYPY